MPIDNSRLKAVLKDLDILEEEKAMWLDAGFYAFSAMDFNGPAYPGIITYDGEKISTSKDIVKSLRIATIERWQRTRHNDVKIVEIDSVREELQARNEG